jgi:hypothetical protein
MSEDPPLDEREVKIVNHAKRTMTILARVIRDKDINKVAADPDPELAKLIGNHTPEQALADAELAKAIRKRVTPDLPQLNPEEETMVICQLGSAIFNRLLDAESNDNP